MESLRQRATRTLETGPNNLPPIWCSGKQVRVVKKDIDRYGRIVGMVYVGDICVNEALVESGLALGISEILYDGDLWELVGIGINGQKWGYRSLVASKSCGSVGVSPEKAVLVRIVLPCPKNKYAILQKVGAILMTGPFGQVVVYFDNPQAVKNVAGWFE